MRHSLAAVACLACLAAVPDPEAFGQPPAQPHFEELDELRQQGKFLDALKACQAELKANPTNVEAREGVRETILLASWFRQQRTAIHWADGWAAAQPGNPMAHVAVGLAQTLETVPRTFPAPDHPAHGEEAFRDTGTAETAVRTAFELFDSNSIRIDEGPVGPGTLELKQGESVECTLAPKAARKAGVYTLKLTAAGETGRRSVRLVDYPVEQ